MIDFGSNVIVIVTKFVGYFKARYKIEILGKIAYDFLVKIIKSPNFCRKSRKNSTSINDFRSQKEPSIKSYECFMFLRNFKLEITLKWWITQRLNQFSFSNREREKMLYISIKTKQKNCLVISRLGKSKNVTSEKDQKKSNRALDHELSVFRVFCEILEWKSHWTDGFFKDLNHFFFQKTRKSKN